MNFTTGNKYFIATNYYFLQPFSSVETMSALTPEQFSVCWGKVSKASTPLLIHSSYTHHTLIALIALIHSYTHPLLYTHLHSYTHTLIHSYTHRPHPLIALIVLIHSSHSSIHTLLYPSAHSYTHHPSLRPLIHRHNFLFVLISTGFNSQLGH
jgi:hypothetical protein